MAMIERRRVLALCTAVCLAGSVVVRAKDSGATALDEYLAGLTSWSASFTQAVVDAHGKQVGTGRGRLIVVRPGKFRWESAPDGAEDAAQLLVADGRNLWFYDRDLAQATVKPQAAALPQSPAMLLAGGSELRTSFRVQSDGQQGGLAWVRAEPMDAQSDFREARFGFRGRDLAQLVVVDKLGQRSTLKFSAVTRNAPIAPELVSFVLPAGADLIGQPLAP